MVSKKVTTKAVERNRLRRRLYAAIQEFSKKAKPDARVVFYARRGSENLAGEEARGAVKNIFLNLGLLG